MDSVEERLLKREQIREQIHNNLWYGIIAVATLISLIFLPMLGSEVGMDWKMPTTLAGWIVYVTSKVIATVLNLVIFVSFNNQGKINASKSKKYKEAMDILHKCKVKKYVPRSPYKYNFTTYGKKIPTIIFSTVAGLIGITQAILAYNYVELIAYIIVLVTGLIFGLMQMLKSEEYWSVEFYDYALYIEKENKEHD